MQEHTLQDEFRGGGLTLTVEIEGQATGIGTWQGVIDCGMETIVWAWSCDHIVGFGNWLLLQRGFPPISTAALQCHTYVLSSPMSDLSIIQHFCTCFCISTHYLC